MPTRPHIVPSATQTPETSRATVVAVVAATTVAQVASAMGIAVFPVIAPELAAEMGVEPSLVGYQMSLLYGSAVLSLPFLGLMIARWGACRATQVGLALSAVAIAIGLTSSLWALVVTSILLGAAISTMTPASAHLLFRFTPPQNRNFIFSLKQTGVPIAWMLVGLGAPGITVSFGWRWSLAAVLAVALVTLLCLQPVRASWDDDRDSRPVFRQRPFAGIAVLWRYPALRWLAGAAFCLSFVQLCLSTFAVTMLVGEMGYSLVAAGFLLSLVQASGVAGRMIWGWVADRSRNSLGVLAKLSIGTTVCCVIMVFMSPSWPAALAAVFFVVFGTTAVGWNGLFLAEVAHCSPRGLVGATTAGAMVWSFGGILVGPALFAATYRWVGSYSFTFGLLALVAVAAVVMLMRAAVAQRRAAVGGATL